MLTDRLTSLEQRVSQLEILLNDHNISLKRETTVVNVKVEYIRPKYNNLKEWTNDKNNVYIGRKGIVFIDGERFPKVDSIWANHYKINNTTTRELALLSYKNYIMNVLENNIISYDELMKLDGKNLGCWCKHPTIKTSCHGDILVELLLNYKHKNEVDSCFRF